jgi:serine/threonine-protein kinase
MEQIGKYRVVRVVGEGGMGRVYEATDPVINRRVAIKTISKSVLQDTDTRARFLREAQAAGRLSHANLITIYDVGENEGLPFIVMEYLEGEELGHAIAKKQLTLDAKLRLMIDVCQGLAYAHSKGLIHRDIKPANIFLTTDQQVKILDFGLARGAISEITQTGRVVGTPSYMAPEQVRGDRVDHRADIFACGVVMYELISGQKPFKGESVPATIFQVLERQPEPLDNLVPNLPPALSQIVVRAIAKDPAARYQSIDELLVELVALRAQAQPTTFLPRTASQSWGTSSLPPRPPTPSRPMTPSRPITPSPSSATPGSFVTPPPIAAESTSSPTPGPAAPPRPAPWIPWVSAGAVAAAAIAAFYLMMPRTLPAPAPAAPLSATVNSPTSSTTMPASKPVEARPSQSPAAAQPPATPAEARTPPDSQQRRTSATESTVPPRRPSSESPAGNVPQSTGQPPAASVPVPPPAPATEHVAPASPQPEVKPTPPSERPAPVHEAPPPPAPVPSAPPATALPTTPLPSAPPTAVDPAAGLNEIMGRYKGALESRDMSALKQIWPGLGGRQETAIRNEFENARSIAVTLQGITPVVSNNTATVTCRRSYAVTTVDGRTLQTATRMIVTLNRTNGSWVIDNIRHEAER